MKKRNLLLFELATVFLLLACLGLRVIDLQSQITALEAQNERQEVLINKLNMDYQRRLENNARRLKEVAERHGVGG